MHYFKLAMAAGASIIVATKLSPAYALPPTFPLDSNGPIRQGDMCVAQRVPHALNGLFLDSGPGYDYFEYCGVEPRAGRKQARHHEDHRTAVVAVPPPQGDPWAIRRAAYQPPLDSNGPIRQGDMCIARRMPRALDGLFLDTGPGYDYFEYCGADVSRYHHRHAYHVRHHHKHAHHAQLRHAKEFVHRKLHHRQKHIAYLGAPATQQLYGVHLSYDAGHAIDVLLENQQVLQPSFSTNAIETIASNVASDGGGVNPANPTVTSDDGSGTFVGIGGLQDHGESIVQLFAAGTPPTGSLAWTRIAEGAQVAHSIVRPMTGARVVKVQSDADQRPAPVEPALSPYGALGPRTPLPQLRSDAEDTDQIVLTSAGFNSPAQSQAIGGMPVTPLSTGYSPIAAVIGLAFVLATPLALVATQLTVADKAAVIETVSDPMTESEWYAPTARPITVDQRMVSASRSAAPVSFAGAVAIF